MAAYASSRRNGGSGLVYWEKQGANRMCALHCINSLLQGPVYNETEMCNIGYEFDRRERQLLAEGPGGAFGGSLQRNTCLGDGGNVAHDGYFNVSVLLECLRRQHVQCISAAKPEARDALLEPDNEEGFILNLSDHWLALRKVHGIWYDLDSLKASPKALSPGLLRELLNTLVLQGYACFVARGDCGALPSPRPQQVQLHQYYLTKRDIDELQQKAKEKEKEDAKKAEASAAGLDEEGPRSFLAKRPRDKTPSRPWPTDGGYRLDVDNTAPTSNNNNNNNSGSGDIAADDDALAAAAAADGIQEDADLQEALRLSLETYRKEMQPPAAEPPEDATDVCVVVVRLRNGQKVKRRFRKADTIMDVFRWTEYEAMQQPTGTSEATAGAVTGSALIQTAPRRKFCKLRDGIYLCTEEAESISVTSCELQELGFQRQEQLMMAPI